MFIDFGNLKIANLVLPFRLIVLKRGRGWSRSFRKGFQGTGPFPSLPGLSRFFGFGFHGARSGIHGRTFRILLFAAHDAVRVKTVLR